jgi:hypothetical protein
MLNSLGQEGWELVTVDDEVPYLKRPQRAKPTPEVSRRRSDGCVGAYTVCLPSSCDGRLSLPGGSSMRATSQSRAWS